MSFISAMCRKNILPFISMNVPYEVSCPLSYMACMAWHGTMWFSVARLRHELSSKPCNVVKFNVTKSHCLWDLPFLPQKWAVEKFINFPRRQRQKCWPRLNWIFKKYAFKFHGSVLYPNLAPIGTFIKHSNLLDIDLFIDFTYGFPTFKPRPHSL